MQMSVTKIYYRATISVVPEVSMYNGALFTKIGTYIGLPAVYIVHLVARIGPQSRS